MYNTIFFTILCENGVFGSCGEMVSDFYSTVLDIFRDLIIEGKSAWRVKKKKRGNGRIYSSTVVPCFCQLQVIMLLYNYVNLSSNINWIWDDIWYCRSWLKKMRLQYGCKSLFTVFWVCWGILLPFCCLEVYDMKLKICIFLCTVQAWNVLSCLLLLPFG
jgi:hypothetical protein